MGSSQRQRDSFRGRFLCLCCRYGLPSDMSTSQQHPCSLLGILLSSNTFRFWEWLVWYIPSYVKSKRLLLMKTSAENQAYDLNLLHYTLSQDFASRIGRMVKVYTGNSTQVRLCSSICDQDLQEWPGSHLFQAWSVSTCVHPLCFSSPPSNKAYLTPPLFPLKQSSVSCCVCSQKLWQTQILVRSVEPSSPHTGYTPLMKRLCPSNCLSLPWKSRINTVNLWPCSFPFYMNSPSFFFCFSRWYTKQVISFPFARCNYISFLSPWRES